MWNELEQYLSGLSFVTTILRDLVYFKPSPRGATANQLCHEAGEVAAADSAVGLSPSATVLFFGIRRALRDARHRDKERHVVSGTRAQPGVRTPNVPASPCLAAEGKAIEPPSEKSAICFRKTTGNDLAGRARLTLTSEMCRAADVSNSCPASAVPSPSTSSSRTERALLPFSPRQSEEQQPLSEISATIVRSSSHFFSALREISRQVACSASSCSSSAISPSSCASANPGCPLGLRDKAGVSSAAAAPGNSLEVSESVRSPRPLPRERSLASCFASCSLQARQEEAIKTLVQAVLLEARAPTTNRRRLEDSASPERTEHTPADTVLQERDLATVGGRVSITPALHGYEGEQPTGSAHAAKADGSWLTANAELHLQQPTADGYAETAPWASVCSLHPSVPPRQRQGMQGIVLHGPKLESGANEGPAERLGDAEAWRKGPGPRQSTAPLLKMPQITAVSTLSCSAASERASFVDCQQSSSAPTASSLCSTVRGESAASNCLTRLENLVSLALPLARGVALRVRSAVAAGLAPDTFSRGRYGTAVALKKHGPVSLR